MQSGRSYMYCKVFKRGRGKASGIDYLMNDKDADGNQRIPPAQLMRGDISLTKRLINDLNFAQKYTSGVLSWSESPDKIEAKVLEEVMDSFQSMVSTGLENDRINWLWVKHQDKGRVELHWVIPNLDLSTGKRFAPYFDRSDRSRFRAWERLNNAKFAFSDPSDPTRKQKLSLPQNLPLIKAEAIAVIHSFISMHVKLKKIHSRQDIIHLLKCKGYQVNREGKDYISIEDQEGKKLRLRGAFYSENFSGVEMPQPQQQHTIKSKKEIEELKIELDLQLEKRKKYIKSRYKSLESLAPESLDPMFTQSFESSSDTVNMLDTRNKNDSITKLSDKNFKGHGAGEQPQIRTIGNTINGLERAIDIFCRSAECTLAGFRREILNLVKNIKNINMI
jgi:hypothetical protein